MNSILGLNMFSHLSIKKKITISFASLLVLVAMTAMLTYSIVLQIEKKVILVEVMDDFSYVTLEIRRFEKNYFLYRNESDYQENQAYLEQLKRMLRDHADSLTNLGPSVKLDVIEGVVSDYIKKIRKLRLFLIDGDVDMEYAGETEDLENQIRKIGQKLTSYAEETAKAERLAIKALLKTNRTIVVSSLVILFCFALLLSMLLGRKIVSSLKRLERYTQEVAAGNFIFPADQKVEMEIHAVYQAFNRMNNELRFRQSQIVQTEKLASLGTLLAGVAHELNNPLSNISTSVEILSERLEQGNMELKRKLIVQVMSQADKARDIVKNLLEFSRTKEFSKAKIFFNDLVQDTLMLIQSDVPPGISFHLEASPDFTVYVDKQRMQQIFLNLFKNAIDAIGDSGNVWVYANKADLVENGEVEILIEDDGPGIEQDKLKHIFDPFFTTKDVGKGSGLGLSIVHEIIQIHGGTITVDSRPGEGTTFVIWLPGKGEVSE